MFNRRTFIKNLTALGLAGLVPPQIMAGGSRQPGGLEPLAGSGNALRITGTFLDEISHDIPHQN